MRPADQRLERADLAAGQIDQRLVVQLERLVLDRLRADRAPGAAAPGRGRPSPARRSGSRPPSALARRAPCRRSSAAGPGRRRRAAPAPRRCWRRPSLMAFADRNGSPITASRRASSWLPPRACSTSACRMANSSPPSRATVSCSRNSARSRAATPCSSRSPTGWPSVSLTHLKWSRSTQNTAKPRPLRRRSAIISSMRSAAGCGWAARSARRDAPCRRRATRRPCAR